MTIIGLMGAMNVGKVKILKNFVDFVETHDCGIKIEKTDFNRGNDVEVKDGGRFSKIKTPDRVIFTDIRSGGTHTILTLGGDRDRTIIRLGIATISRIAKEIIGVFSCDESLNEQFKIFDMIRHLAEKKRKFHVCLSKCDLLVGTDQEKQQTLEIKKKKIISYFKKQKISVERFHFVYFDKNNPEWIDHNSGKMISRIIEFNLHPIEELKPMKQQIRVHWYKSPGYEESEENLRKIEGKKTPPTKEDAFSLDVNGINQKIEQKPPFPAYDYESNDDPFIFASYAHSDKNIVYPIINRLNNEGINVWYDEGIPPSDEWPKKIVDALIHCNSFLVFLTRISITRPNVKREINFSLQEYDKGKIGFFPVYLEKLTLPNELKFFLEHIQALMKYKIDDEAFYIKLISKLKKKLKIKSVKNQLFDYHGTYLSKHEFDTFLTLEEHVGIIPPISASETLQCTFYTGNYRLVNWKGI